MLALVVGRPAAIEPLAPAFQRPRAEPAAPPVVEAAHHVAVGVGEEGEPGPRLDALGEQERRPVLLGVVDDFGGEAEGGENGRDLVREIAAELGSRRVLLAGRGDRDTAREIGLEPAVVEIGPGAGNRGLACHRCPPMPVRAAYFAFNRRILLPFVACREPQRHLCNVGAYDPAPTMTV